MPSRCSTSPSASPSGAGSRASTCDDALDEHDLAPEPPDGLGHFGADRAAAEHEHPPRHRLHPGRLAVGPDAFDVAQRIGGMKGSEPFASTTLSAV